MCISVPQAQLNLSRQFKRHEPHQFDFGNESRLEGQILQMVLQQCQYLKYKHIVGPKVITVSHVAVQMSQTQTSSLTKCRNVNFVAVPIFDTQTYILTYYHHDTVYNRRYSH